MRRTRGGGFTLIELLVVVAIIGIVVTVAVGQYQKSIVKAKEAVLKQDLYEMRTAINRYFADKGKYPASLESLVEDGYLRKIPVDPFTESADTWQTEAAPMEDGAEEEGGGSGVYDVHSGAPGTALDGSSYSEW